MRPCCMPRHIPIKLLATQGATALSIGADVMLVSTRQGSAMDIAGTGQAKPLALLRSLHMVIGIAPILRPANRCRRCRL